MNAMTDAPLHHVPTAFVRKLYRMLDLEDARIIAWDSSGESFTIYDASRLDKEVLSRYVRGRFEAFRQQLLAHGFEQTVSTAPRDRTMGGRPDELTGTHQEVESYRHAGFVRGHPELLGTVVRLFYPKRKRSKKDLAGCIQESNSPSSPSTKSNRSRPRTSRRKLGALPQQTISHSVGGESNTAGNDQSEWAGGAFQETEVCENSAVSGTHTIAVSSQATQDGIPLRQTLSTPGRPELPKPSNVPQEEVARWLGATAQTATHPVATVEQNGPTAEESVNIVAKLILFPWSIQDDGTVAPTAIVSESFNFMPVESSELPKDAVDSMLEWCDNSSSPREEVAASP